MKSQSASSRLFFGAILSLSLFSVYLAIKELVGSRRKAFELAEIQTRNLAQAIDLSITNTVGRIDTALLTVVAELERSPLSKPSNLTRLKAVVATQERMLPEAVAIRVTDDQGTVILNNPGPDPLAHFRDRPFFPLFRDHPEAGLFVSKPLMGRFTHQWVITCSRRFNRPDGRFGGVVVAPVLLVHFQRALSSFDIRPGTTLTLRDGEGGLVARHPTPPKDQLSIGDQRISSELRTFLDSIRSQETYFAMAPFDQVKRVLTVRRIKGGPLFVVAGLSEQDFLAIWRSNLIKTLTLLSIFLLGSWILAGFLWQAWKRRDRDSRAVRDSEERLRSYLDQSIDVIFTLDPQGAFQYVSPAWERHYGYPPSEVMGKPFAFFVHPEDIQPCLAYLTQVMSTGQSAASPPYRVKHIDGSWRTFEANGTRLTLPGGGAQFMGVAHDITHRLEIEAQQQALQAQLQQTQKMESLGGLAGGVAHDMNNVLSAILGLASATLAAQSTDSPIRRALETIIKAAERGGKMVNSLLSFARRSPSEFRELDMNALLQEESHLLERTTLAKVRLVMELAPDLHPILGDPSALSHALMNLCVNAVDAMPERGTLTLQTWNGDDGWIEVVVADTGTGMPKDILDKALDPFFTTKEQGKGTGLGLSLAHATVMAHGGQMALESEPGRGTRVRLRFPAVVCATEGKVVHPVLADLGSAVRLKVLLVDDDELVQSSIQTILSVMGHDVAFAMSGEEALQLVEAGYEPQVIILDLNMPGLGGAGALPRLRALRPSVPVLLATGRADQVAMDLIQSDPLVTLLPKPFGMSELKKQLDQLGAGLMRP